MTDSSSPETALRVVVVNDDITQLNVMTGLLEKDGLRADGFTEAEAALAAMDREGPPDLIVTDLYMPDLDGWRFCRLLRSPAHADLNGVPILVVSATFSGDDTARITADLGANAFLPAPVDGRRFIGRVRTLLGGGQPADFLRCLIIDDDETLAGSLERAFSAHGYGPDTALTAEAARQKFHAAAYDVTVIDYHLPDGLGDDLLTEFRTHRPDCVHVMMTNDPQPSLALDWMKKGAAAFLRKPFEPEYLIEVCARVRRERALLRVEDLLEQRTRELRENEERYRLLFTSMDSGLALHEILCDERGTPWDYRFLEVNPAFETLLGLPAAAITGRTAREVLPNVSPEWIDRCGRVALTGESLHMERYCAELDKHLAVTAYSPVSGRFVTIFTDITERKRAEADRLALERRLQQARKAESLARMAGAIAHHFNNQVGAVMGNIELALEDLPPEGLVRKRLSDAMAAADRAAEVSRLMLAYRGQIAGKPEVRDLAATVRDTLPLVKETLSENVRLEVSFPESGIDVRVDAAQLGQVLTHLVENAGEAVGGGPGEIRVRVDTLPASAAEDGRIFPVDWVPPTDPLACLSIADSGCGVAEERIDQLFDPYFTTKEPTRGLGLAVVLGSVTGQGGAVAVESRLGAGSTFRVLLPLAGKAGPPPPPAGKAAGDGTFKGGGTVLLVEDQAPVRDVTQAMLERMGFSVIAAENGAGAVNRFAEHRDRIRCVICDLTMPGMNGWQTLRALRAMRPDLPAILARGYDEAQVTSSDREELAQAFLFKPYQTADLREALGRALETAEQPLAKKGR